MTYTFSRICSALGADASQVPDPLAKVTTLLTDSRSLTQPEGVLFFAIRTDRADGHRFIPELYRRGVRNFVVESGFADGSLYPEANFVAVPSPAEALRTLAAAHRSQFSIPVVALTGSRGKTLVKEWLYLLMRADRRITRSPRSYNSQIGVPLSLWEINADSQLAVIEAGISCKGEMDPLREMIRPDIVVLTGVGEAHDDGFSSRLEKVGEKLRLASGASTLVYPSADSVVAQAVADALAQGLIPKDITLISSSPLLSSITEERYPHLTLQWERDNAATCAAVMTALGYTEAEALSRLADLRPMGTRLNVAEGVNHSLVVTDDYLCDLHSLAPALDFISRRSTPDRALTLIIGDMEHESATAASQTYAQLGLLCNQRGVASIIGIGPEIASHTVRCNPADRYFSSLDEALATLSPTDFDHRLLLVKSSPSLPLHRLTHMLEARTHETVLEVNLDAMVSNYNFYRSHLRPSTGIVAMVKASGYGAGSYELAKTLQSQGAAYLAVAVLDEGLDLRAAGITMPIMVLNPKVLNYRQLFANRLEPEIFDFNILNEIIAEARKLGVKDYPVHIKLDTGMHRLGFLESDLDRLIATVRSQDCIRISSVFSHLATADCFDMDDYTHHQLSLFSRASARIVEAFPEAGVRRHILNTAGIIRFPEYQYDMVRLGIGLYGVPVLNDGSEAPLRQVSTLRTVIISVKEWEAGTTIGYGRRGVLTRRSRIATIPIGYADGINRHMGRGRVSFLVNGVPCPTVGNICMDICMIDVTDLPEVKVGDSVEIFGERNPVGPIAEALDTIGYEILTSVSPRVRRLYYSE